MKTIQEIEKMIITELNSYFNRNDGTTQKSNYYNEVLGDTSFLMAGLFQSLLKTENNNWKTDRWIVFKIRQFCNWLIKSNFY